MSDTSPFGFGRFVPGFDFLQNLAKNSTAGVPAMPGMSSWVAPTVNEEELEKRIEELKAVQFWLDQNSRALTATVQALEVQKMTLATLKGMNVAMGDLANAFTPKPQAAADAPATPSVSSFFTAAPPAPRAAAPAPEPEPALQDRGDHGRDDNSDAGANAGPSDEAGASASNAAGAAPGVVDPMQWWTALSAQFQQIATHALKDVAQHQSALDATRDMAAEAVKTATGVASSLAAQGLQGVQDVTRKASSAAASKKPGAAKAPAKKAAPQPVAKAAAKKSAAKTPAKAAPKAPAKKTAPARAARPRPAR